MEFREPSCAWILHGDRGIVVGDLVTHHLVKIENWKYL
jgi:hypothetical protein